MDYKYNAIILGSREIGETDRVYSFLTKENGKVRAIGRGTRKPVAKLAGNLEPITQVEVFIHKTRGLGNISGVIPVNAFSEIKKNIIGLEKAFSIFKILERILPDEQMEKSTYSQVESFLVLMDKSIKEKKEIDFQLLKIGLLVKIFDDLGYRLEADKCVECGKKIIPGSNYFDFSRGGISCRECHNGKENKMAISDDAIKVIRVILANKLENLPKLKLKNQEKNNLEKILETFYQWISG